MKIIEWNCQGAFRNKNEQILSLSPDILIVLECESEDKLKFGKDTPTPNDFYWYSKGKKGVGIFSYSDYKIKPLELFNSSFDYVIPLLIYNELNSFLVFAVWAMNDKENHLKRYIGQVWLAINFYKEIFNDNVIIIGDFNSNQIWDEKERLGNHTDVVEFLSTYDILSLYHKQENLNHGLEKDFTFYMYRNIQKKYHIDYIFTSSKIVSNGFKLTIGEVMDWINLSDHTPLILEINDPVTTKEINYSIKEFICDKFKNLHPIIQDKYKFEIDKTIESINDNLNRNEINNIYFKYGVLKEIETLSIKLL